jgi:hypothetical protein
MILSMLRLSSNANPNSGTYKKKGTRRCPPAESEYYKPQHQPYVQSNTAHKKELVTVSDFAGFKNPAAHLLLLI